MLALPQHFKIQLEQLAGSKPRLELRRVLLAVSGGRDSMALLHLARAAGMAFAVAHLDHALRDDSSADAAFVRDACAMLEVEFVSERVNVGAVAQKRGWSFEDAARRVRYEFLSRSAKHLQCDATLTAHTLEDNAETVLLQLLRGTARATGIPPRRDRVLRPLLSVSKRELEAFLTAQALDWREDASNADLRFTRNWVRLKVLPLLETRFSGATTALARYATIARAEDAVLEDFTTRVPESSDWRFEPVAVQRRLIRRAFERAGINTDFEHLEQLRSILKAGRTTRVSLPGDALGFVQHGQINIIPNRRGETRLALIGPTLPPELLEQFPNAVLRPRAPGDVITLPGGTKKLAQVLIDRKILRETRDELRVLAVDHRVIWVGLEPPLLDASFPQPRDAELEAMRVALELAQEAFDAQEVPVGAVVLRHDQIVGRGRNRSVANGDMTRHAELEAIRDACQQLRTPYLTDCTLIVTLEPCLMCFGASLEARIPRIVFGARNPKNGALGGVLDATRADWNHQFEVRPGVLEKASSQLLTNFFETARKAKH